MRLGLFCAVLGTLAAICGMVVPVPGTFEPVPPGARAAPVVERGLAVRYLGTDLDRYFPHDLRLTARRATSFDRPGQPAYIAVSKERPYFVIWWPAGRDSVDIAWHHSPTLRLPLPSGSEGTLIGRGGEWAHLSIYSAMLNLGAFTVEAREVSCASGPFAG